MQILFCGGFFKMNYAAIKKFDIANGPGVRVSLFVSGCRHRCKNCFNSEAWDFNFGEPFNREVLDEVIEALSKTSISGFTLLGGEPFEPENQPAVAELLKAVKQRTGKNIWCFTGFLFEDLLAGSVGDKTTVLEILKNVDILVDGKFVEELKSPALIFRGSSNQRILNVPASLEAGCAVWADGVWERTMGSGNIYE